MEPPSEDKRWASKYLLDPLTAPEPSQETGPGSHFNRPSSTSKGPAVASTSKTPSVSAYPTPPTSASPTKSSFHPSNPYSSSSSSAHRQAAFGAYPNAGPSRKSIDEPTGNDIGRRRGSSLGERFPGDMSHRPLDQLRKEAKAANRAPHLKKKHLPGADVIDVLDKSVLGGAYHHEGPYDATLLARNTSYQSSPVEATRGTNAEAIRATPRENIKDSLDKHVPLQGTAIIPPGMEGYDGRPMTYEEGADLMRELDAPGGAYKRWAGIKYLPGDYKGKGEPSYSIEKSLKDQKSDHRRILSDGNSYEMQPQNGSSASRQRSASGSHPGNALNYSEFEGQVRRSNTTGRRVGEGLKRRFGSLRRSKKTSEVNV
ncbi:uncharacterized protein K444DRAFT_611646 [Hyaloscypha bicolor E]|uniref:Pal1-domain-containing protein n=1 Tax=Hyaloscypha bicolor E TaxID=1095630 RepID=A0A2J6TED5_9HELO|nr:uncharacterized protein K444DRAFT_611646 [Hyaloscypha bicolor E]PMD61394.1 hypothetical protein K444DRAFT_611646 [Hyaloscypha bicolor E]